MQLRPIIVGTAGHVDHGKTTLIQALTGVNPDRLKEEQDRGMTIDLGFAPLELPDKSVIGIIDVPGHSQFLKNMLAGAGGMDIALLIIAADEGIMPQTREHFEILQLLNISKIIVVLTKSDLVDDEMLQLVREEVIVWLNESQYKDSLVVNISAKNNNNLNALKSLILEACESIPPKDNSLPFRMPIDRVFSAVGFGTVITGTIISGSVKVGDNLEILPQRKPTRVRSLQHHNTSVDNAVAGQRTAMNITGLSKDQLYRGQVCAEVGKFEASELIDAKFSLLQSSPIPLQQRQRIRLHIGTTETFARVILIGQDLLEPGKESFIQLAVEEPIVCARGDRFIIRRYSPPLTIGGGTVLIPQAIKHRSKDANVLEMMKLHTEHSSLIIVSNQLKSGYNGLTITDISRMSGLNSSIVEDELSHLEKTGNVFRIADKYIKSDIWSSELNRIVDKIKMFHEQYPIKNGITFEQLRKFSPLGKDEKLWQEALTQLHNKKQILRENSVISLPGFTVQLNPKQQALLDRVINHQLSYGVLVPTIEELSKELGLPLPALKESIAIGFETERIIKIDENLIYPTETINDIKNKVSEFIKSNGNINVAQFRDLISASRKYAVPLIEYFDSSKFTRRIGDNRVLYRG